MRPCRTSLSSMPMLIPSSPAAIFLLTRIGVVGVTETHDGTRKKPNHGKQVGTIFGGGLR